MEDYIINYEYLVLTPLIILADDNTVQNKYITRTEILEYEKRINEEVEYLKIKASTSKDLDREQDLIKKYRTYLLTCENAEESIYALKTDANIDDIANGIYNTLPIEILDILTNVDIIEDCFLKNKKLTLTSRKEVNNG